jgi:cytochrome oxidase Cu insertion factor (SCO1/SenC/PrrC family)
MSKTRVWLLLGFTLLLGLVVGCSSDDDIDCSQVNNAQLEVGDEAPDFRLPDHRGGYVRLSDFKGKSNVVIAFYPAAFTPV